MATEVDLWMEKAMIKALLSWKHSTSIFQINHYLYVLVRIRGTNSTKVALFNIQKNNIIKN